VRRWLGRHGVFFEGLVVTVAVAAELEVILGDLAGPRWLLVVAVPLYTLPLLARRRWPMAAALFVVGVQVVSSYLDEPGTDREAWGVVAYVLAFWVFASDNPLPQALLGLTAAELGIVLVTVEDVRVSAAESGSVALVGTMTWLAAAVLRQRSQRVDEAERRAAVLERDHHDAAEALARERARIARELHDVVAHSVSVMIVQAGAARMMLDGDAGRAVAPLLAVEETGRQALSELRRLLGILRSDAEQSRPAPQPGVDDLPGLVDTVREAGLPVVLEISGDVRPLSPGLGLAVYRIVQEALTNILKHAGADQATVTVSYGAEKLTVEVRDDGRRTTRPRAASAGHGLTGMRERAAIYGGTLEAGPRTQGDGYVVNATLPIEWATP
jgi:signal transduction histidine kinase